MLRIALAPCSPFSVTGELMAETAELARRRGVRLHTHLAETLDEEAFCLERFGVRPVEYLEDLGWLGDDVWLAHCVHLSDAEVARFGATGTGVAHCPTSNARLGAGIAPVGRPRAPRARRSASASTAPPPTSRASWSVELRAGAAGGPRCAAGPRAMTRARGARARPRSTARAAWAARTSSGSLEPGKLADVALWRLDGLGHAGIADPVAALVLGAPPRVELLLVGGRVVVEGAELRTADEARWPPTSRARAAAADAWRRAARRRASTR